MNATSLYKYLDEMAPWDDRLQVLECLRVVDEAPDVKSFAFRSDSQTWFRYQPGQFITLELPAEPEPLMRTYTLSSSPSRPFSIAVTVKAQADSIGTRWMFDNLKPGDHVRAFGPSGDFSLHNHPAAKYLFLSAGSGITPMMSMLLWLNDFAPQTDVAFINCSRRYEDLIFRRELELVGNYMHGLSLDFLLEERARREGGFGHVGRIDGTRLKLLAPDFAEREIFCCGPDPFMRAVRQILEAEGFDMAHYHQESFGAPTIERVQAPFEEIVNAEPPADAQPVRFASSDVEAMCLPDQTILQTARAAGVRIPAACEFGLCGTCKTMKLSGEVEMSHNGGILDHEIEEGYILACCSRPLGPVTVEA
ncbi:FAD-binding oxidoreductase [Aliihoeflea sp. PC F10.4]